MYEKSKQMCILMKYKQLFCLKYIELLSITHQALQGNEFKGNEMGKTCST